MKTMVVAAVLVAGCLGNPVRDAALARANAAHTRGDLVGEALALRDACNAARDDKDLCKRADQAWQTAQGASQQRARTACQGVDDPKSIDACLAAAGELRRLSPTDPEAARLVAPAAAKWRDHCVAEAPKWQTSLDDALDAIRCEDARAAQIALSSYDTDTAATRAAARGTLLQLLARPGFAARRGATSELLAAATCVAPTPDVAAQARAARAGFVETARAAIDLRAQTSQPLPELCGVVAGAIGERAACIAPRDGAPAITIAGDVTVAPVEHSAYETQEQVDYVAGIIREPNPAYQPAVAAEQSARQSRDTAESQARRDRADCDSANSSASSCSSSSDCPARDRASQACARASSSESLFHSRQSDYDSASSRLRSTPPQLERQDVRTAHYVVRHHSWRTAWRARLRNDGQSVPASGDTVATDDETAGAPVAGVAADPLTPPGDRWYVASIRDQVAAKIAEIVDAALKRRASDAVAGGCGGELAVTPEWLDCWARARLWIGGQNPPDALVRALDTAADAKRGAAWPPLACASP
jgi:hypothetical protein